MDPNRFDQWARLLPAMGTRRGLLGLLGALPFHGGLLASQDPEEAEAKERRRRRKQRHKQRAGQRKASRQRKKKKQQKCRSASRARICAGACGTFENTQTCGKRVDCGSCDCDPLCPVCQICESGPHTPGACVPDPAMVGDACGDPGQLCQADGVCACDAGSCSNPAPVCVEGGCEACSASAPCLEGCCAGDGTCQPGTAVELCGADGETCQACSNPTPICVDQGCTACSDDHPCPGDQVCWQGSCACGHVCAEGCHYTTIQQAIDDPQGPETIQLCAETYTGATIIDRNLTLLGAGPEQTTLDGEATVRVLEIGAGVTVAVQDLTITNGSATNNEVGGDGEGAGILNAGVLNLRDVSVTGNQALAAGGISNLYVLTLKQGSRVSGNSADIAGGIYNTGSGTLTLEEGSIVGGDRPEDANSAVIAGGILNDGTVILKDGSRVSGNSAFNTGGIHNSGGRVTLEDGSQVTSNSAGSGGAFQNEGAGTITVANGALVCNNTPIDEQCVRQGGMTTYNGPCPNPANGVCPG